MATRATRRDGRLLYTDTDRTESVMPANPEVFLFDDFIVKAADQTSLWTIAAVNSGAGAYNAQANGAIRLTTGAADDDDLDMASGLCFTAAQGACVEIRMAAADVTAGAFCIGFSDAQGEAADLIALDFSDSGGFKSTASDAVAFVLDPDKTANDTYAYLCAVKGDTDATEVSTGVVPVAATYNTYRIELLTDGTANGYIDGELVATIPTCITVTDLLCVYIGVINREAAANTWDVDYVRAWQRRA